MNFDIVSQKKILDLGSESRLQPVRVGPKPAKASTPLKNII